MFLRSLLSPPSGSKQSLNSGNLTFQGFVLPLVDIYFIYHGLTGNMFDGPYD
jgi:hypothetical protein